MRDILFRDIAGLSAVWAANPIRGIVGGPAASNVSGLRFDNVSFGRVSAPHPWVCEGVTGTSVSGRVEPRPVGCGM